MLRKWIFIAGCVWTDFEFQLALQNIFGCTAFNLSIFWIWWTRIHWIWKNQHLKKMVSIVGNWWKHRFHNLLTKMCLQIRLAKVSFLQCSVFPLFHYNVMLHKGFITNKTSETQIKVSKTCFSGGWQCTDRMTHYKYHHFIVKNGHFLLTGQRYAPAVVNKLSPCVPKIYQSVH